MKAAMTLGSEEIRTLIQNHFEDLGNKVLSVSLTGTPEYDPRGDVYDYSVSATVNVELPGTIKKRTSLQPTET